MPGKTVARKSLEVFTVVVLSCFVVIWIIATVAGVQSAFVTYKTDSPETLTLDAAFNRVREGGSVWVQIVDPVWYCETLAYADRRYSHQTTGIFTNEARQSVVIATLDKHYECDTLQGQPVTGTLTRNTSMGGLLRRNLEIIGVREDAERYELCGRCDRTYNNFTVVLLAIVFPVSFGWLIYYNSQASKKKVAA